MNKFKAELLGMHAGDGTLYAVKNKYVIWELRGGLDEINYYTDFITSLVNKIFLVELIPKHRKGGGNGSFGIRTANKKITKFLSEYFPIGEKSSIVRIPKIIFNSSKRVQSAFVRGLFDTDGCIRFDKNHTKRHYYPKIEFGFVSKRLRDDLVILLKNLNIGCHIWNEVKRNNHRLCVPGKNNLKKWMNIISSNNPKHLNKITKSIDTYAVVAQPGTAQTN